MSSVTMRSVGVVGTAGSIADLRFFSSRRVNLRRARGCGNLRYFASTSTM